MGVAVREGRCGRQGGPLECRAGQTEEVRGSDQKGLQSYVSRHLKREAGVRTGGGKTRVMGEGVRGKGWEVEEVGRAEIFISVIKQMLLSQVTAKRGKK